LQPVIERASAARTRLKTMRETASGAEAAKLDDAIKQLDALEGGERRRRRGLEAQNLNGVKASLLQVFTMLQEVDVAPTTQAAEQVPRLQQATEAMMQEWQQFENEELTPLKVQP